jgi:hypothetical protein
MHGRRGAISVVWLAAVASGCGGGSAQASQGTITGVAEPCVAIPNSPLAAQTVSVTLSHDGHVIARQIVRGLHVYRFSTAPGTYVVSSSEGEGSMSVHVTVYSGHTVHANIPYTCT